jgi:hypothetical protein
MTTDECIAISDDELVERTYAVVDDLAESDDARTAEAGASPDGLTSLRRARFDH